MDKTRRGDFERDKRAFGVVEWKGKETQAGDCDYVVEPFCRAQDDEKRLAQWINFFTLSLQIATLKELAGRQTAAGADPKLALDASWIQRNDDVSSFWLESFGEVVSFSD